MKKLIGLLALVVIVSLAGCTQVNQTEETTGEKSTTEKTTTLKKTSEDDKYVYYEGKITVSGKYSENYPDTLLGGTLCFYADEETGYLIPRDPNLYGEGKGDERNPWFCFKDQDKAKKEFGIDDQKVFDDSIVKCIQGQAKVEVSNYIVDKLESSVFDTAVLENIVSQDEYKKKCD